MDIIKTIGLSFVNAYLLKAGDGFILIDTGLSIHRKRLLGELYLYGALPDRLKLVIVTHGDYDHAGNCKMLRDKYGVMIAMHKADLPMVANGLIRKRKVKTLRNKFYFLVRQLFGNKLDFERFTPDIYFADGQNLQDFGLDATVLYLPGHTHGSIGILTSEGNFFAGDTFSNTGKPDTARLIENPGELQMTLSRLRTLKIKTIYPGHGAPFDFAEISGKL
jgi:glyoxylase-like metal-dependent hydrolase (beta-lactamase superfamily II)